MRQLKRSKLELRGLMIGLVLGDGSLSKTTSSSNSRFTLGHSSLQKNYLVHKLELVSNLLRITYAHKSYSVFNKKTSKYYPVEQGSTGVNRYLTKLRKLLYTEEGTKVLTEKTLNWLTEEGLAYWYMDDGGMLSSHKRKYIGGCFLSTQNFTYEEHLLIKKVFKERWNIDCKIGKHGKDQFRISMNKTNSVIFLALIEKYKLPEFNYKFCLNYEDYVANKPR